MEDNNFWITKVRSFETESIEEMEDKLNNFFENKFIISSPIFPITDDNNQTKWYTMVYFKIPPREIIEKEVKKESNNPLQLATEKQVKCLKNMKYKLDYETLTKQEATKLIKEALEKKK